MMPLRFDLVTMVVALPYAFNTIEVCATCIQAVQCSLLFEIEIQYTERVLLVLYFDNHKYIFTTSHK